MNRMQLYSWLISVIARNQESINSFPFPDNSFHSINADPLPKSVVILSSVKSCNELIKLFVNAETAVHARSIPSLPFLPACPFSSTLFFRTLTSIKRSLPFFPVIPRRWEISGSPPFYATMLLIPYAIAQSCSIMQPLASFQPRAK